VGGSITRAGLARDVAVVPGLCCKCAYAGSRVAKMAVDVTRGGRGAAISVRREVPRSDMVLASHSGSCEHGCSDQSSRQKFKLSHSISPREMRSQTFGFSKKMREAAGRLKRTVSHVVSTPREVGASCDHEFRRQRSWWRSVQRHYRIPGYTVCRYCRGQSRSSGGAISVTRSRIKAFFGNGATAVTPSFSRTVQA
jgi:hypothetical protein